MGQSSRRRKGKSGSRSNTPTPSAEIESKAAEADEKKDENDAMDVETTTKEEPPVVVDEDDLLVLTSEKRRGVYECDYCHSDISQQPRIRCAVCSDFDLCLDCFATSDHEAMIARIKASAQTQTELTKDGIGSTAVVVSSAAANHEADHKYRVCDSTRYPMFPTGRVVPPEDAEASAKKDSFETFLSDDPKTMWTAEEDLRLIDAIATHGLGNWVDISEAIGGHGSVGKTPKRCMERYLDDFLGRYGHILPQYTIVDDSVEENAETTKETEKEGNTSGEDSKDEETKTEGEAPSEETSEKKEGDEPSTDAKAAPSTPTTKITIDEEEGVRTSKRRSAANSSAQGGSLVGRGSSSRKKLRAVATESFPGYETVWPKPYLPAFENAVPGQEAAFGKEVARDQSCKAEIAFVKSSLAASTKEEADKIRKTWVDTKLGKVGSPTVLPPRPQDAVHLLGSELAGFMPRRGDFDVEHENDAETAFADMEFIRGDKPEDKELKLKVLQIYCEKLDEREKRKKFVLERHLYDYRKYVQNDMLLPMDERDLVHRMRLFERFHTPDEHKKFIEDILKAKRLRKEIAKLQMYRRMGIKSLAQAEMYELDKDRRQFHKKLEGDAKAKAAALAIAAKGTSKGNTASEVPTGPTRVPAQMKTTDSLWKQYRTSKNRRNSNRSTNSTEEATEKSTTDTPKETEEKEGEKKEEKEPQDVSAEGEKKSEDEEMKTEESKEEEKAEEKDKDKDEATADVEMTDAEKPAAEEKKDETTESEEKTEEETIEIEEKKEEEITEIEKKPVKEFDMTRSPCRDLLSRKELALCERQQIYPVQYLEIKKVLIHEALINGLLDKETASSSKRTIVKIDVERRGNVVDFLVRAGWISRKLADVAMRVVTPQPS